VLQRHSLHTIAQLICYTDVYSKSNLVLKTGEVGRRVFDCYLFQCSSEVTMSSFTLGSQSEMIRCRINNLSRYIDVHTHAGSTFDNHVTSIFDLLTSGSVHSE